MAVKYSRAYVRPNTSVAFYQDDPEFLQYCKEEFLDTGLAIKFREVSYLDNDQLSIEIVSIWTSTDAAVQCKQNERVNEEDVKRRIYNETNGITLLYVMHEDVEL